MNEFNMLPTREEFAIYPRFVIRTMMVERADIVERNGNISVKVGNHSIGLEFDSLPAMTEAIKVVARALEQRITKSHQTRYIVGEVWLFIFEFAKFGFRVEAEPLYDQLGSEIEGAIEALRTHLVAASQEPEYVVNASDE